MLSFFYFCLRRPLLGAGPSLSVVVTAFALSSLLSDCYCGAGCCCTNCWGLVIPWLTMYANSPGAFDFLQSRAASAVARIRRTSQMESASWFLLYLYLDTILRWGTLISAPQVCCASHSVLARITTTKRLMCTRTPYPSDFSAIAAIRSTLVTTVSLHSKIVPAVLTNCCRMFVASGISALSVMAMKS